MNLEEFVEETLVQIVRGVAGAGRKTIRENAIVNPDSLHWGAEQEMLWDGEGKKVEEIEFDVALTTSEQKEAGGKVGLSVMSIGGGVQGSTTSASSSVSRVKFSVPLSLPRHISR